jgi:hypothetical protein
VSARAQDCSLTRPQASVLTTTRVCSVAGRATLPRLEAERGVEPTVSLQRFLFGITVFTDATYTRSILVRRVARTQPLRTRTGTRRTARPLHASVERARLSSRRRRSILKPHPHGAHLARCKPGGDAGPALRLVGHYRHIEQREEEGRMRANGNLFLFATLEPRQEFVASLRERPLVLAYCRRRARSKFGMRRNRRRAKVGETRVAGWASAPVGEKRASSSEGRRL